ncbi:DUF2059 domain-containing protein [Brevundimonas sp.]|uniref:DUF2059 domain-containing protein n=1 Tax=Brevundimonas sp. TaxID=1871086 RepID=UPI001A1CFF32|nr:DUF2059 domain-containing protein [Brevundimonas sp.]MBJ7447208.1 DUF2059 domain-containing protein [Brevundimonas sp.]
MRSLIIAVAALCLTGPAALAQEASSQDQLVVVAAPDPRLALADRYLALTVDLDVDKMMREQMEEGFAGSEATEEQRVWMTEQMTALYETVIDKAMLDMRGDVAELYTQPELEALVALYESPLGPSLARKNMQAGMLMQEAMMPHLLTGMTDVFEKYCLRFDCEAMGAAAAKQSGAGR